MAHGSHDPKNAARSKPARAVQSLFLGPAEITVEKSLIQRDKRSVKRGSSDVDAVQKRLEVNSAVTESSR